MNYLVYFAEDVQDLRQFASAKDAPLTKERAEEIVALTWIMNFTSLRSVN